MRHKMASFFQKIIKTLDKRHYVVYYNTKDARKWRIRKEEVHC